MGCLVSPVGSIKYYRFSARKLGVAPEIALNVLKDMLFFMEASLNARPARTKSRPEEWLSSPDRAHQDISICIEEPPRAPYFRARARQKCDLLGSSCRRARPVRTKSRPREWLSSPDRAHQDLSMCIEKPPSARFFRARARQKCDLINCTREFVPACPPCPN